MDLETAKNYKAIVLPNILEKMKTADDKEFKELYKTYRGILRIIAPYDFEAFNTYLEIDEDKNNPNRGFYFHRKDCMSEIINALNDMEIYDSYDTLLISTPPRVGKFERFSSKVLVPDGWKCIGDMKIGDKIIGKDGHQYEVTGVFPQGKQDLYRVTFDDDTFVDAGLPHLWTVQTRDDRLHNKERTVTTGEMMKHLYVDDGKRKNYSIKYISPAEFTNHLTDKDISPYTLGVLLGDGCLTTTKGLNITSLDQDIIDRVAELDSLDIHSNGKEHHIRKNQWLIDNLKELKLIGTYSHTKFIPKKYLYSSVANRSELLRGLMDTDGYCCPNNHSYCEFCTTSEQLGKDVLELVRSLGGRAKITTKMGSYKNSDGNKIICKKVYRIFFNLEAVNPFWLKRKAVQFKPRATRCYKYIKSIEKVDSDECYCISVNTPDKLYVTDGYNVTHNTTMGIRFLSWILGRHPDETQLATSYSESITGSFYIGVLEVIQNEKFKEMFPKCLLVNQNAKKLEIWVKEMKRLPSITFVPINGSMTGRAEAGNYLYCDDLVSGIEEAMSITRLEKLWQTYTVNARQRKKSNCKEIHIATRWSVHDPMSKLEELNKDNPRFKSIKIPCIDENGDSNFNFFGGFTSEYYEQQKNSMDDISFNALYMQNPIEREGILYQKDELQYYFTLPDERPDAIISVCDSKNMGKDYVASPIGYVYGDMVYIEDVVFNNGLPEVTRPLVANKWIEHNVVRADVEMNNGGNYYAEDLDKLVKEGGGKTSIRMFFTSTNKIVKIISYADYIKKHFVFKHESLYKTNSPYAKFMKQVFSFTQTGKSPHDDAPDSLSMLAQLHQDLSGNEIKILNRKELGL